MVFFQNCGVTISSLFILFFKIVCELIEYFPMYNKRPTLTSIPERAEEDVKKWVPKNKHEVLKAKYKCLKKLFQIYDASVIGILPEHCNPDAESIEETERSYRQSKRKKRSTRTKSDACAGTSEYSNGDGTENTEETASEKESTIATAVIRDLKVAPCSCTSTQFDATTMSKYAGTQESREDVRKCGCECTQTYEPPQPLPHLMMQGRPRLTRFQCFIQRIFGIRRDYSPYAPDGHIYAASDNNIMHTYGERRRRRGLRFRRLRRPKKTQSEVELRNVKSPMILNCVQSVQRNCLMDTTPRQCPITGCRMISYGIINYNDHLNLCHFTERKYICHYCHEGFENENDKYMHENEHLGITKLNLTATDSSARESTKKASITQTDPEMTKCEIQEEKLKKIVSFFDKISEPEQVISRIKKERVSESNLHSEKRGSTVDDVTTTDESVEGEKRTVSCVNLRRKFERKLQSSTADSDVTSKSSSPVCCNYCGENFDFRRQLSLHMDLEHRTHGKFSKFHSCAGIVNQKCPLHCAETRSTFTDSRKSEETITRDPSTDVVYTSIDGVKPSVSSFIGRGGYQWEPGTKIIRV